VAYKQLTDPKRDGGPLLLSTAYDMNTNGLLAGPDDNLGRELFARTTQQSRPSK